MGLLVVPKATGRCYVRRKSFDWREGFIVSNTDNTQLSDSPAVDMRWYILKVAFNREDTVAEALRKRIALSQVKECFDEILVPTEDVVEFTRAGKRKIKKRKLYPGYIMVRMSVNDDSWFLVREVPGIGDFTGAAGKPTPMKDDEVERIIRMTRPPEDDTQGMKTSIPFKNGDRVRVKEGNFQNLEGDVDRIDEANGRVTVIISIFGRSTPVELDHWQIESI